MAVPIPKIHRAIIKPQGKVLQDYFDSQAAVQIIIGPLGSGKTIQTCVKIPEIMSAQKPNSQGVRLTRFIAARNTYSELFTTTIRDWMECNEYLGDPEINGNGFNQGGKKPPAHILKFRLEDGTIVHSEMIFLAFDRPDHVKKARGIQATGIWLNETKELAKPVVDMLDLRHGRYPSKKDGVEPTWHGMLGDTNAPDEDHWLYRLAEEEKPKDWAIFKQPGGVMYIDGKWIANPNAENTNNLPKDYYLRGVQGKADDWIHVNLANEYGFVSTGKPVHPRYVDSVHCQDIEFTPDINTNIILGFDFGRTPACAFLQRTSVGGWVCFDEFLAEDMSALTFAPELKKYIAITYPNFSIKGWGDPSGGNKGQGTDDTPVGILNAQGINCRKTETNDPLVRRSAVESPLREVGMDGKPRLIILPKCKMIRKGLAGGFCYKRIQVSGQERYHDEPDKNEYSHPVEALEYGLQGEGEGKEILKPKSNYTQPIIMNQDFKIF